MSVGSVGCGLGATVVLNVAVTASAAFMVTAQLPVPVHAPLQPPNVEPTPAVCARVTSVPLAKLAAHVPGQVTPAGVLVTVPLPDPAFVTVRVKFVGGGGGGGVVLPPPHEIQTTRLSTARARNVDLTAFPILCLWLGCANPPKV